MPRVKSIEKRVFALVDEGLRCVGSGTLQQGERKPFLLLEDGEEDFELGALAVKRGYGDGDRVTYALAGQTGYVKPKS